MGKYFPVTTAHSGYFRTLIKPKNETVPLFNEEETNEVSLEDVDHETMSLIVGYMYSLHLPRPMNTEQVTELLVTADRLQINQLVTKCISLLMCNLKKTKLIQTLILIDKFEPKCAARKNIFEQMKKNKKAIAKSPDFPLFVKRYPDLVIEFMQAALL